MNLPSRGLRLSATTIRNTGAFFAPMRFMRILTAINFFQSPPGGTALAKPESRFPKRRAKTRHAVNSWQVLFWVKKTARVRAINLDGFFSLRGGRLNWACDQGIKAEWRAF